MGHSRGAVAAAEGRFFEARGGGVLVGPKNTVDGVRNTAGKMKPWETRQRVIRLK